MTDRSNTQGRVALITGAAGGIGAATARAMASSGITVVGADIDRAGGERVFFDLGSPHRFKQLDVRSDAEWRALVAEIVAEFGRLDILHLNAGVMVRPKGAPLFDDTIPWLTVEGYHKVREVNLDGVVYGVLATLGAPGLTNIVITASAAAILPLEMDPYYTATKFAELGFGLALAPLLEPRGIRVDVICPGAIDTPITAPDVRDMLKQEPPTLIAESVLALINGAEKGPVWLALNEQSGLQKYDVPGLPGMSAALDLVEEN